LRVYLEVGAERVFACDVDRPLPDAWVDVLTASWQLLDDVAAHAPAELRKGPRGRGRDVVAALRAGATDSVWPARYLVRRTTWHVLDHAWEIQDKSA